MSGELGKWLIGIGGLILLAGVVLYIFGDKLGWIGSLPGDIQVDRENFRFYFPITTMIILSIVLSILLTVVMRIFRE